MLFFKDIVTKTFIQNAGKRIVNNILVALHKIWFHKRFEQMCVNFNWTASFKKQYDTCYIKYLFVINTYDNLAACCLCLITMYKLILCQLISP